jgi:acetyltransferase
MVMSPHPEQLECSEKLPDGTLIRLRSVRPEDESLLQDLAAHMSPQDMRLRFLAATRGLSHELAARLSHIDRDRDVALLAFAERAEEVLGVARFSADPDNRAAEFAIAVRTDWKGHGLGHLLMARLTQLARQRGIDELVGEVLPENTAMLQLCREFGFTIGIGPVIRNCGGLARRFGTRTHSLPSPQENPIMHGFRNAARAAMDELSGG